MKNFNCKEIENYEYDFNCSGKEDFQNILLKEAIKAIADGKIAVLITTSELMSESRKPCKKHIAYLLQKDEIEKFGIELTDAPQWKDIRDLEALLETSFIDIEREEIVGLCIYDSMDDAETSLGYSEALDEDEMPFLLIDISIQQLMNNIRDWGKQNIFPTGRIKEEFEIQV